MLHEARLFPLTSSKIYTYLYIGKGICTALRMIEKPLRQPTLLGTTCCYGEIPAIISPDEKTTA
jgi:hypothetical protein